MVFKLIPLLVLVSSISINQQLRMPVDDYGRALILHGVNAVYKQSPYLPLAEGFDPEYSLSEIDIEYLLAYGFNLVRLGVLWEAVEVAPGVYNQTYLKAVETLVNSLGHAGIYTMIDSHQDLLTRALCGEGMPTFLVHDLSHSCDSHLLSSLFWLIGMCRSEESLHLPKDENGNPLLSACVTHSFYKMYLSPETNSLFAQLYNNVDGLQDKFVAYWEQVHNVFASNPYILGYDLLNEPWPGNFYANPSLLLPGHLDRYYLQPMYNRLADMMRNHTLNATMLFEPVQFGDVMSLFGGISFKVGFTAPPGSINTLNALLNDHSYCCEMSYNACKGGEPTLKDAQTTCASFNRRKVLKRKEDAERLQVGLIISEFGACFDTEACAAEIGAVTGAADEALASWAYWQYKGFGDFTTFTAALGVDEGLFYPNSTVQATKVKALARTYAQATQGIPQWMHFNPSSSAFAFQYLLNKAIPAPTQIYYNAQYSYPGSVRLTVNCAHSCSPAISYAEPSKVTIGFESTSNVQDGSNVTVLLTPDATGAVGTFAGKFAQVVYEVVDTQMIYPGKVVITAYFQAFLSGKYSLIVTSANSGVICELNFGPSFSPMEFQSCELPSTSLVYDYTVELRQHHFLSSTTMDVTVPNLNGHTLNLLITPPSS
jgi:endoglycosylceramidase